MLVGVIERRILVNYRVQPAALTKLLPPGMRPVVVKGYAMAGICLIRLVRVRPQCFFLDIGLRSENAAHRIAVEWDEHGQRREGVYIPRRDTNLCLNALAGGRIFPGEHHPAVFEVGEDPAAGRWSVHMRSKDQQTVVEVDARSTASFPAGSVFGSLAEASGFFERGAAGYSATSDPGRFDGIELRCPNWVCEPLAVEHVYSSFFADEAVFGDGVVEFDHALLMRDVDHSWHALEDFEAG
ncbi:hypothetical protein DB30_03389 [Enhygromyxa salina]|uniref:DUF2071 domain-containing protein n=1 Tax=Enhygromyxa salina TaxID=215803 RepID=A0A0C2DC90_9BACT|nr:hypothetical protein DB30_03389 [Enhygromyxa salina]